MPARPRFETGRFEETASRMAATASLSRSLLLTTTPADPRQLIGENGDEATEYHHAQYRQEQSDPSSLPGLSSSAKAPDR